MTRDELRAIFTDATEEQITELLNKHNGEVAREKAKAKQYKEEADKSADLQKQLDAINEQNLSETEKANKALEKATARIAELEKASALKDQRSLAATKFNISIEQANQVIKDDGSFDVEVLGQIIAYKEKSAAEAKEKEIANGSTNPGGSSGTPKDKENTIAEEIGSRLSNSTDTASIVNSYT